ncbi:MAG: hypothetical protein LBV22_00935 [Mycoplasmataceae bacterium]|jgi:hypothetical protein|nr:hypothetical protein [Mycoplasmataceae bacterium]
MEKQAKFIATQKSDATIIRIKRIFETPKTKFNIPKTIASRPNNIPNIAKIILNFLFFINLSISVRKPLVDISFMVFFLNE